MGTVVGDLRDMGRKMFEANLKKNAPAVAKQLALEGAQLRQRQEEAATAPLPDMIQEPTVDLTSIPTNSKGTAPAKRRVSRGFGGTRGGGLSI